ncbi:UNVERIFIED_CONTAM: hypothetical protein Scaly_2610400 [Sesamum calycinum]|uniref:Reverse transcriptase RNase H-like domain-containing protein n=1 Tax=Sesamum calycinum TaxID=2727403 RepID=A0AAW2JC99_9LAMI
MMLKEKGNAIQDSRVGLGSTLPKPIRIAIKRIYSNYVSEGFASTEDHKREENLGESVFNRLGPHRKTLHGLANKQSVFDRSGPYGIAPTYHITLIEDNEVEEEDAEDAPVELKEGKVNKHIEVGFIREVKYPMWISSILPERSVGILLARRNDEGKKNALYYLSRTMTPNELKYSPIEKLCLTLIFSIQKLKHYFQSHSIHLVSKANPLKYVMAKLVLLDRLARWYLQMQQFEITYVPQKAVKGQVLANFLVNHPIPAEWELSNDLPNEDVLVIEVTPP